MGGDPPVPILTLLDDYCCLFQAVHALCQQFLVPVLKKEAGLPVGMGENAKAIVRYRTHSRPHPITRTGPSYRKGASYWRELVPTPHMHTVQHRAIVLSPDPCAAVHTYPHLQSFSSVLCKISKQLRKEEKKLVKSPLPLSVARDRQPFVLHCTPCESWLPNGRSHRITAGAGVMVGLVSKHESSLCLRRVIPTDKDLIVRSFFLPSSGKCSNPSG